MDDSALLRQYAINRSDAAFAALVTRHVNLVYSVALRQAGHPQNAEEITQAVFIILAKKAAGLRHEKALSSWLFQAARLTAINFVRSEIRRRHREQEAHMQTMLNGGRDASSQLSETEIWRQIAPLLDDAVAALREKEQRAIVLRFYEGRNLREVGLALGASEDAAKKRIARALEKLRQYFAKRGVVSTTAAIAEKISAHSVQAAPVALAKSVTAVALAKGAAASTSTLTLIKGALKIMAWTKVKTAIVVTAGVLLAAGTTTVVEKVIHPAEPSWANDPRIWHGDLTALRKLPEVMLLRSTKFSSEQSRTLDGFGTTVDGCIKDAVVNLDIRELLKFAYGMQAGSARVLFPEDLPRGHFDFLFTMPGDAHEVLSNELKTRFGLTAHRENREMAVLSLRLTDLKSWERNISQKKDHTPQMPGEVTNPTIDDWIPWLESKMGKPVVNQTGLTGHYDMTLKWNAASGEAEKENLKQALLDQLGLEFVATNMPIEMLVVEKAK